MSEGQAALPDFADAGVAGTYPPSGESELRVAPGFGKTFNVYRMPLIPLACWRMDELWFDFDSSFPRPEAATELPLLYALRMQHGAAPMSVFGHADPVGDDPYNKTLSGRRADAVYGLLTRDTARWEKLYGHPAGGDQWGLRTTQVMLRAAGYDPGPADGVMGRRTRGATESFQKSEGLTADGDPGPKTRAALYANYMDLLCVTDEGGPFRFQPADFLAKGADPGGKGDVQGCSEFNPLLVFSRQERTELSQPAERDRRNAENAPNRRVVVFLFRPGSEVAPGAWPCPRVSEGIGDCKKRFWSDGETRRTPQATRRKFGDTSHSSR